MTSNNPQKSRLQELEETNRILKEELKKEELKILALTTMIEIAERDLGIDFYKYRDKESKICSQVFFYTSCSQFPLLPQLLKK
ncbi:MAG: hypothetical protein GX670_01265 [Bacteroidales bacterium]|nr:hypothetical protein [Bacteroidales bacterium]